MRRFRSSSSIRRETPSPSPCGTKTTKRPGSETSVVSLRALRLHRILDGLDEHRLAALDQILDLARALAALELRADDLVDVEEAVLLEADLDERGLHARQDVVDDAEVDVAGDRVALRPLEVDLGDLVVLEHGDALLAGVDRDQQLALRLRQRRALRRRAAARLRRAARGACARASCAPAWRASRPAASAAVRRGPVGGLLLAVAPSAGAAAALVRCGRSIVRRCPPRLSAAGSSTVSDSTSRFSEAAAYGACSAGFLRRNQGNGKRSLLSHARAQPRCIHQ